MSPEATSALNFLAGLPTRTAVMPKAVLREILLYTCGNTLACGRLYDIVPKNMGAGVYKVSLKLTHG